jgi:hypothetical protein
MRNRKSEVQFAFASAEETGQEAFHLVFGAPNIAAIRTISVIN